MASNLDVNSLFRVDGLVAVITGGGSGIGLIMAKALATNGAKAVYILGRRLDVLSSAAAASPVKNIIVPVQCDVTSKPSIQAAVDRIAREQGYVNLVVANSGIFGPENTAHIRPNESVAENRRRLFEEGDMAAFTQTLHVNVTGAFFSATAFLELLDAGNRHAVEKGGFGKPETDGVKTPAIQSQVVFTSSVGAFSRHASSSAAYASSKAAVLFLTKKWAGNMAGHGIRANALCPGLYPSELAAGLIGNRKPEEEKPDDSGFIPARRFGTDKDMAGTILYLASRAGSFCNGLALLHDGGRVSVMPGSY